MPDVSRILVPTLTLSLFSAVCSVAKAQDTTTESAISVDTAATSVALTKHDRPLVAASGNVSTLLSNKNSPAAVISSTETKVIARWNGGELTNTELSATLQMRRPRQFSQMPFEQLLSMPAPRQRELVEDICYEEIIFEKAKAEGITEDSPEIAPALKDFKQQALARLYFQREVQPKLQQLDENSARAYYEAHKDLYTQPAQTLVRNLHMNGYTLYHAREGDTLATIAKQISGKEQAADKILRGEPPFYRRAVDPRYKSEVPESPLKAGETLLVPIPDDEMTSKVRFAQQLRKRLLDGENVEKLIATYSEPGERARPNQPAFVAEGSSLSPELRSAIARATETSVTEVIRTPWGADLFYIDERVSTHTQPFAEVREKLITEVTSDTKAANQTIENARKDTLERLRKQFNVQINTTVLNRPDYKGNDPLTGNTPIITADDFTYTLDEFLNDLLPLNKPWEQLTAEQRVDVAKNSPALASYLVGRAATSLGLDKNPNFEAEMHNKAIGEITSEYLRRHLQKQLTSATDQELRAYYNSRLDKYTSPSQVTVREISKRVSLALPPDRKVAAIEEAKKALSDLRAKIKSQADFEQTARRESEAISTRSRGGLIGTVPETFRGESFRNQIAQLKEGEVSEPFLYGSEVMIVRLDDRTPPVTPPFEEILRKVREDYMREVPKKKSDTYREQVLKEAGLKLEF